MRSVSFRDVLWMLAFGLINIVLSMIVAGLLSLGFDFTPNRIASELSHMSAGELEGTLLSTVPQLFGEELLTLLPFLAVLQLAHTRLGLERKKAVVIAWIVSALIFGAAHLPTYDWNLIQCFGIIGAARLVLTLAYIKTKNIWVSFGAHVTTDWSYFATSVLLSHAAASN